MIDDGGDVSKASPMARAYVAARAEAPAGERERFHQLYGRPFALGMRAFAAPARRCWSRSAPAVHVAFDDPDSSRPP